MSHRIVPHAIALGLAAVVTLVVLAGLDGLAHHHFSAAEIAAAQSAAASTAQARNDVASPRI